MQDDNDEILEWFHLFFLLWFHLLNRRDEVGQWSNITYHGSGIKRKLLIKLFRPLASNITGGSHVSMDNSLGIDFGFWPPNPILATRPSVTLEPIDDILRKNVKKRSLVPFSDLKKLQKRQRLEEYRLPLNKVMSLNNLLDLNQSDILHYSNKKKQRKIISTSNMNLKTVDDL